MKYVYNEYGHEFIHHVDGTTSPGPYGLWGEDDPHADFIDEEAAKRSASMFWPDIEQDETEDSYTRVMRERQEELDYERACNEYQDRLLAMEENDD